MQKILQVRHTFEIVWLRMADNNDNLNEYWIFRENKVKMWILPQQHFDNHKMALMLIDILYEQKLLNDATYRNIKMKYGRLTT